MENADGCVDALPMCDRSLVNSYVLNGEDDDVKVLIPPPWVHEDDALHLESGSLRRNGANACERTGSQRVPHERSASSRTPASATTRSTATKTPHVRASHSCSDLGDEVGAAGGELPRSHPLSPRSLAALRQRWKGKALSSLTARGIALIVFAGILVAVAIFAAPTLMSARRADLMPSAKTLLPVRTANSTADSILDADTPPTPADGGTEDEEDAMPDIDVEALLADMTDDEVVNATRAVGGPLVEEAPFAHTIEQRRFAARACNFSRCNAPEFQMHYLVAGEVTTRLPYTYVLVPFRNRLDNLARLVTSINNATTAGQRACMCILVVDFNTNTSMIPAWKNQHCLATLHDTYNLYLDEESLGIDRDISKKEIAWSMKPQPCRSVPYTSAKGAARRLLATPHNVGRQLAPAGMSGDVAKPLAHNASVPSPAQSTTGPSSNNTKPRQSVSLTVLAVMESLGLKNGTVTPDFSLPLHVDVSGLDGISALGHVLSLFDGSSTVIDGLRFLRDPTISFSRAGAIQAGLHSIKTPAAESLVFICDTDMVIRPGFFSDMLRYSVPRKAVFYPVCWHMCFGMGLDSLPRNSLVSVRGMSRVPGFWRKSGLGMMAAYLVDLQAVHGLQELAHQKVWGGEDNRLFSKFRRRYHIERRLSPQLIHMYHSRFKDWQKSPDGMFGGPKLGALTRHVCSRMGFCACPKGTTAQEITVKLQATFTRAQRRNIRIWDRRLEDVDTPGANVSVMFEGQPPVPADDVPALMEDGEVAEELVWGQDVDAGADSSYDAWPQNPAYDWL